MSDDAGPEGNPPVDADIDEAVAAAADAKPDRKKALMTGRKLFGGGATAEPAT